MAELPPKKRCGNTIEKQKELLCAFIASNENLRNNKLTANFTFKDAKKKWLKIAAELNTVAGGAVKDWKSWRETWHNGSLLQKIKQLRKTEVLVILEMGNRLKF